MTFGNPWMLALLVAVPLIVWLHRRRAPAVVRVASVAPYRAGPRTAARAERRGTDPLLVALVASAVSLGLAAASPAVVAGPGMVLVLRDVSPSMGARTGGGTTVGASADARADALLATAGLAAERWVLRAGEDLAAKVEAARAAGFGGVLLVTDRAPARAGADVVVAGPSEGASPNASIERAWLDGDRAWISVRHHGGDPLRIRVAGASGPVEFELADGANVDVEVPVPSRGGAVSVDLSVDDALDADDHVVLRRVGGVRRARLVGVAPRTAAALRALGVDADGSGPVDATVSHGGTLGDPDTPSVHVGPRSSLTSVAASGFVLEPGPRDVAGAAVVGGSDDRFPLPSPALRLVATGRIGRTAGKVQGHRPLLADSHGTLAAVRGREVAILLDPEDPASDWHRDATFVATLGAALDLVVGGPERLESEDLPDAAESDVAREPAGAPDPDALRAVARAGSRTELAAALAAAGALAAGAAAWIGARRR